MLAAMLLMSTFLMVTVVHGLPGSEVRNQVCPHGPHKDLLAL